MTAHPVEHAAGALLEAIGVCTPMERAWLIEWLRTTSDKFEAGLPHGHVAGVWRALALLVESYTAVEQQATSVEEIFRALGEQ